MQLADKRSLGPSLTFDRTHLLLAFTKLGESGRIGRHALATSSGLGEGAVRTLLKKLREEGYADADASGCHLTRAGEMVYRTLSRTLTGIVLLRDSELTVGAKQVALAVRGSGASIRSGIEQRDAAIRVGATGATTYSIRAGRFTIPGGSSDCEKDFPSHVWRYLRKELGPRDSDAVILCGADTEMLARLGALAAALTLL